MFKKLFPITLISFVSISSGPTLRATGSETFGRKTFQFSKTVLKNDFLCFSESYYGRSDFVVRDGFLMNKGKYENKVILKNYDNLDDFSLSADFSSASDDYICPIDSGLYFYASGPENEIDGIKAYEVNVEKGPFTNDATIKIHVFNHSYLGEIFEKQIKVSSYPIHLEIKVKQGDVAIFVNKGKNAIGNVHIEEYTPGQVGIRYFRSCISKVSNFSLLSKDIPLDFSLLENQVNEANEIDFNKYSTSSAKTVNDLLNEVESFTFVSQDEINSFAERIEESISKLIEKRTKEELSDLIKQANDIISSSEDLYTSNSIESLKSVVARCENIDLNDIDLLSFYYSLLLDSISRLIKLL